MLEKMGWSPGKGLGAKEQGVTSLIKLKSNASVEGFGFKSTGEEWTKQQAQFNDLLGKLSENNSESTETFESSLEEKSKKSKRRVHYKKFARGKDVSRYSKKDLNSIVGLGNNGVPQENYLPQDFSPTVTCFSFHSISRPEKRKRDSFDPSEKA